MDLSSDCRKAGTGDPLTRFMPISNDRPNNSPIDAQGGPVGRGSQWTANEDNKIRNFLGCSKPFQQAGWTYLQEEELFKLTWRLIHLGGEFADKIAHPFGRRRPGKYGVYRYSGADCAFRQSARNCQLCGFRTSIMNHLNRNLNCGFTGNEDDATPVFLLHRRQICSRQANSAQDIHLEKPSPFIIIDFLKWLRIKNAEIIYQYVDRRVSGGEGIARFYGG